MQFQNQIFKKVFGTVDIGKTPKAQNKKDGITENKSTTEQWTGNIWDAENFSTTSC